MVVLVVSAFLISQLALAECVSQSLVYPELLESRSDVGAKFLRITDDLTLRLRRASVVGDTFTMTTFENGEETTRTIRGEILNQHLYEDPGHMSSLIIHERSDGVQVRGLVSPTMRIEPVTVSPRSDNGRIAHVVSRVDSGGAGPYDGIEKKIKVSLQRDLNQTCPDAIDLELAVITDHELAKGFTSRYHLTLYVMAFFNSVNIRFHQLQYPKVQFRLVGLFAADRGVEEKYLIETTKRNEIPVERVVRDWTGYMWKWFNTRRYFGQADAIYLMTKRTNIYKGKALLHPPGFAEEGGICKWNKSIVIGHDDGMFASGVDLAARLLAHVAGAPYDKNNTSPPGNGCDWKDGYLLGDFYKNGANHTAFSTCSLKEMVKSLVKKAKTCFNFSSDGYSVLPGDLYEDTDEYCGFAHPDSPGIVACSGKDETCTIRCCNTDRSSRLYTHQAPDGTECYLSAYNKICIKGMCVDKPQRWKIDYPYPYDVIKPKSSGK